MNIEEFRTANPSYADKALWSDKRLAEGMHKKFYSTMDAEEFYQKIGYSPAVVEEQPQQEPAPQETPEPQQEQPQNTGYTEDGSGYSDPSGQSVPIPQAPLAEGEAPSVNSKLDPAKYYTNQEEVTALEAQIEEDDKQGIESDPWVDPTVAITGPVGYGAATGKGLVMTAKLMASSLLAEPAVGTGMQVLNDSMTENKVSPYVRVPVNIMASIIAGTAVEGTLLKAGNAIGKQLSKGGVKPTAGNIHKYLTDYQFDNQDILDEADTAIQKSIQRNADKTAGVKNFGTKPVGTAEPKMPSKVEANVQRIAKEGKERGEFEDLLGPQEIKVPADHGKAKMGGKLKAKKAAKANPVKPKAPTVDEEVAKATGDVTPPKPVEPEVIVPHETSPSGQVSTGNTKADFRANRLIARKTAREAAEKLASEATEALKVRVPGSVGFGFVGGGVNGIDTTKYQETGDFGDIEIDVPKFAQGFLYGATGHSMVRGQGLKVMKTWEKGVDEKLLAPMAKVAKSMITNDAVAYQLGIHKSPEAQALARQFKVQSNVIKEKMQELGNAIAEVTPNKFSTKDLNKEFGGRFSKEAKAERARKASLGPKALTRILEGGSTNNPTLAIAAKAIQKKFAEVRKLTDALEMTSYSQFNNVSKKDRNVLRTIMQNKSKKYSPEEMIVAQKMMWNHYNVGTNKSYLPYLNAKAHGLSYKQKKIVKKEIKQLQKESRAYGENGNPEMETEIKKLQKSLKQRDTSTAANKGLKQNLGFAMQRQVPSTDSQQAINRIVSPAYRVAKGLANQELAVLKENVFKEMKANIDWVIPKTHKGDVPGNYKSIPANDKEWGSLAGTHIRNDVFSDMQGIVENRSQVEQVIDRINGYWKYGKVIISAPTHVKNTASNIMLATAGDVAPWDVVTYTEAFKMLTQKKANKLYQEAKDWGLYVNTFAEHDLNKLRDSLADLNSGSAVRSFMHKVIQAPSSMYEGSEQFFKSAVFAKARADGLSVSEAGLKAERYLFNYSDIPPALRHYKRWGAPFITYSYKAIPRIAHTIIAKPHVAGAVLGLGMYMGSKSAEMMGFTDEEVAKEKRTLPQSSMMNDAHSFITPIPSGQSDHTYINVKPFMPWGGMGESWGQSSMPFGDVLPSHPVWKWAGEVYNNKNSFTGKEIYDDVFDTGLEIAGKWAMLAYKEAAPSIFPKNYAWEKIADGLKNAFGGEILDAYGDRKELGTMVGEALVGIKLQKTNQDSLERFAGGKMNRIVSKVQKILKSAQREVEGGTMTEEEYEVLVDKYSGLGGEKLEKIQTNF